MLYCFFDKTREKVMKCRKLFVLVFILFISHGAFAQVGYRSAIVENIQAESASRVGYENIIYIKQTGAWSASNCPTTWAYFNSKTNPHFTSIFLAARVSNMPLVVNVDDTYQKIDGFCEIININM